MPFLKDVVREIPRALVIDGHHLGRAMIRLFVAFPTGTYRLGSAIVRLLVSFARSVHDRAWRTPQEGIRSANDRVGLAMRFVDAPDVLRQSRPPVNI
jgi:hypothetical protein